jgi:formate/nitrite transporter FocA (FNT family)
MKLAYKVGAIAMVAIIGFALYSTYGAFVGGAVTVGLMFVAFEYIARNDE